MWSSSWLFGEKVHWIWKVEFRINGTKHHDFVDLFRPNDRGWQVQNESFRSSRKDISFAADDHQAIESSIRNVRSLGVIPRAKIKTVKMTLVIVIGKCLRRCRKCSWKENENEMRFSIDRVSINLMISSEQTRSSSRSGCVIVVSLYDPSSTTVLSLFL